jgi:hypothetical protein
MTTGFVELQAGQRDYFRKLRDQKPETIGSSGLIWNGAKYPVHWQLLSGRSRVCFEYRRATARMSLPAGMPAPFMFDEDHSRGFIDMLYFGGMPLEVCDADGQCVIERLVRVIKMFVMCAIYRVDGDAQKMLDCIRRVLCRAVCRSLAPDLFDVLASLAMGSAEQRAHPMAFEGRLWGLEQLWASVDLVVEFTAFCETLPAAELL